MSPEIIMEDDEKSTGTGSDGVSKQGSHSNGSTSSRNGPSSTGSGHASSSNGDDTVVGKGQLAYKETENVNRLRFMVLSILMMAAVGVSVLVFVVSRQAYREEMVTQFDSASARLVDAFEDIRTSRISTLAGLALAAIAHGVDHSRDWPFVTLTSFQQRALTAKQNSGAIQVSIAPLVSEENRRLWEDYIVSNDANVDWIEKSFSWQSGAGVAEFITDFGEPFRGDVNASHSIKHRDPTTGIVTAVPPGSQDAYIPTWEMSPFLNYDSVNVDMLQRGDDRGVYGAMSMAEGAIVVGSMNIRVPGGIESEDFTSSTWARLLSITEGKEVSYLGDPMTNIFIPIFDAFEGDRKATAVLVGLFNWGDMFRRVLPETVTGVDIVLKNRCFPPFTFRVNGPDVVRVGRGDLHESGFDSMEVLTDFLEQGRTSDGTQNGLGFVDRDCRYFLSIYPSQVFADKYNSAIPWILVSAVGGVLLFSILMFFLYDRLVERRQTLVLRKAVQSTAIVSSLFPKNVRDRLMGDQDDDKQKTLSSFGDRLRKKKHVLAETSTKPIGSNTMPSSEFNNDRNMQGEETIADLFPNCTVLFADIAGFTAWSSTREPSQVFSLLQNLYQAFDKIASKRRVFKVETIGDSYVAVTGLPEPQPNHAIIMAKFARDCLEQMKVVTTSLEVSLGPDTGDLSMRFGLNSGQVTGGVLRGDRARFQLFGDTVNTAARMESTGVRGKIQLSQSTADLLIAAGKKHWLKPRKEKVTAKGKGTLQTFFLDFGKNLTESFQSEHESKEFGPAERGTDICKPEPRLLDWMSEVLLDYVKQIIAKNQTSLVRKTSRLSTGVAHRYQTDSICLDEQVESFSLPNQDLSSRDPLTPEDYQSTQLDPAVTDQLCQYVSNIANLYHQKCPFHNFSHACHVTMSVHKLMKRVVSYGNVDWMANAASDPLTLFAIVFSALIHDVDHRGVSNARLSKEEPEMAVHYRHKSVAEQNSFDIAWDLLMLESFDALRQAIFPTVADLMRFRQVVVNIVLATDIFDKGMGAMRKARWDRVFGGDQDVGEKDANTRATIVLEHIIQASDVSHTMQHWHVYIKWNRKLFHEMSLAYHQGRLDSNPADFWYQGELSFFDNYIIPLANKLRECHVFGVSSAEYLNYALSNRHEWEAKGMELVHDMIESVPLSSIIPESATEAPCSTNSGDVEISEVAEISEDADIV